MSIELVIICAVVYLIVASFTFVKLDKTTPSNPTTFERFLVAICWPFSILLTGVVVLITWWVSRVIERSKR